MLERGIHALTGARPRSWDGADEAAARLLSDGGDWSDGSGAAFRDYN